MWRHSVVNSYNITVYSLLYCATSELCYYCFMTKILLICYLIYVKHRFWVSNQFTDIDFELKSVWLVICPSLHTVWEKSNIFTQAKYFAVNFCQFVTSLCPHILTNFGPNSPDLSSLKLGLCCIAKTLPYQQHRRPCPSLDNILFDMNNACTENNWKN